MFIIMNKTDLIDTTDPMILALAKLALFGEIQNAANLHPGKVAGNLVDIALHKGLDPINGVEKLAENLIPPTQKAFEGKLLEAQAYLSKDYHAGVTVKKFIVKPPLAKHYDLDVEKILEFVTRRMKEAGLDENTVIDGKHTQGELVLIYMQKVLHDMIPWAFREAARIIKDREY